MWADSKEAAMKRRNVPRWRQVLGRMTLGLGVIVGRFNYS
jgi:hypothetical protein